MRKGWDASRRTSDLDAAEGRYIARHGERLVDYWLDGWTDYAAGYDFGSTYDRREEESTDR